MKCKDATPRRYQERQSKPCTRCGKGQHQHQACPAKDVTCHRCIRIEHYKSQCFSRTVGEIHTDIGSHKQQPAFIGALSATNGASNAWMVTLKMSIRMVQLKLDTGAEVSAIYDTSDPSKDTGKYNRARLSMVQHAVLFRLLGSLTAGSVMAGNPLHKPCLLLKA